MPFRRRQLVSFALALLSLVGTGEAAPDAAPSAARAGSAKPPAPKRDPIEILRPGTFHAFEVPADSGELWLVVYKRNGTHHAKTRPIRISACEYMSGGGKCISSDVSDSVIFFVRGLRAPSSDPVQTVRSARLRLYPGEYETFQLPNGEWSNLAALGTAREIEQDGEVVARMIVDYRLSFARGPGLHSRQMLGPFGIDSESGPPTIEWAGDLDEDGHVDLLIEQGGSNSVEWMFYLSSKARSPGLLELVASRRHIGC